MRAAVVAEFYPRAHDPVLGVWAHRQARATLAAGAEVTVFVLHRIVAPRRDLSAARWLELLRQPRRVELDGIEVHYVPYVSPPRSLTYARWGAWAAPALRRALGRHGPFDLVHAHNAVPPADAVIRAGTGLPLVVSVHGGDLLWTAQRARGGRRTVSRALSAADLVLANSEGIAERARQYGAREVQVLHLGTDLPELRSRAREPLLATVGHLIPRKRHADVLAALAQLPPEVRYLIVGDGPSRPDLQARAEALGVSGRVEFAGQLPPEEALERGRAAWVYVMPSVDEAFGVAYIEAMAAGVPAIGTAGEPGPAEIRRLGEGIELVPPRDPGALATAIAALLGDADRLAALGQAARATVAEHFSWEACGASTVAAYERVVRFDPVTG